MAFFRVVTTTLLSFFLIGKLLSQDSLVIENLVFEGAGIRGIAYCGALMELDERGYLSCVDQVAGTSSGAITACLISVGYSPQETFEIIGNTDFGKFNDGGWGFIGGTRRLKKKLGYYKGEKFLDWLEQLIEKKMGSRNITFRDLQNLRGKQDRCKIKNLAVAATSLNHQCTVIFSFETYPDMRIADAVHASMAIPLYFEPVVVDPSGKVVEYKNMSMQDHLCVDGGFTANFMIDYFDKKMNDSSSNVAATLGLRLDSDDQIEEDLDQRQLAYQHIGSASEFIAAFYYIIKETMNRQSLREVDWERTVSLSDCNMSPKVKKLTDEEKNMLINSGRTGVRSYLTRPKK
jgi:NTE family protein